MDVVGCEAVCIVGLDCSVANMLLSPELKLLRSESIPCLSVHAIPPASENVFVVQSPVGVSVKVGMGFPETDTVAQTTFTLPPPAMTSGTSGSSLRHLKKSLNPYGFSSDGSWKASNSGSTWQRVAQVTGYAGSSGDVGDVML